MTRLEDLQALSAYEVIETKDDTHLTALQLISVSFLGSFTELLTPGFCSMKVSQHVCLLSLASLPSTSKVGAVHPSFLLK